MSKPLIAAILIAFSLTACSSQPMTPEKSEQMQEVLRLNQHLSDEAQRNHAIMMQGLMHQNAPINCFTPPGSPYTTCQ
ncbi:MAG TPA: hypothetical protein VMF67_01670 [Rhizomicrobium sp.]|nr:hypothetical protein [Rhizomicrobium sp.]